MDPSPQSRGFFETEDSGKLHYETWERQGTIPTALTIFFFHGICESAETLAVQVFVLARQNKFSCGNV